MFAFFHKVLRPKCGGKIRHLIWGDPDGWLAFGGGKGGLTILNTKSILAEDTPCLTVVKEGQEKESEWSNIQTLTPTGKTNVTLQVVWWSPVDNSLTMMDESGCFAVWKRENNVWVNEVLSSGASKGVKDCVGSPDGQKICFLCSDGRLCVYSKSGQKLWSKELKRCMRHVLWSPTGLELLLCSEAGEIFFYDSEGFYSHSLHSRQGEMDGDDRCATLIPVADVDWYPGERRLRVEPALAIAYEDGRVEISVGDTGDKTLSFVAHLRECTAVAWRPTGGVLAVLGISPLIHPLVPADREVKGEGNCVIRFFSTTGDLLHTLVLPAGGCAQAFSWNNAGDKIVVASADALLFAEIRTKSVAACFKGTVVYTAPALEKHKQFLWFWSTDCHSKHLRVVDKVLHIQAAGEGCLVVTEAQSCEEKQWLPSTNSQYALTIYSGTGDVRRKFEVGTTPEHVAFTESHVFVAHAQTLRFWAYNPPPSLTAPKDNIISVLIVDVLDCGSSVSFERQTQQCRRTAPSTLCQIGSPTCSPWRNAEDTCPEMLTLPEARQENSIVALTANACCFVVARKDGEIRRYSLPTVELQYKCTIRSPPLTVQMNSDGSCLAVVDVLQVLRLYDAVPPKCGRTGTDGKCALDILYERPDVSHVIWASDSPDSFAMAQKNVFYVVRGHALEEVVQCSATLLGYTGLCVHGVYFNKLMRSPCSPNSNHLYEYRTKALRDTKAMLQNPRNLHDGVSYVGRKPHPVLWNLLATAALESLSFRIAEEAYTRCQDYFGLLFLKYLNGLDSSERQMAEVYACLGNIHKAEQFYMSAGRLDLALASSSSRGDWSRVLELCREHGREPEAIQHALKELAESHKDNGNWSELIQINWQMQKKVLLTRALYLTEQYEAIYNLVARLPDGDGLLLYIGQKLASVGMCDEAVTTFRKAGHLEFALDVSSKFKMRDFATYSPYGSRFEEDTETLGHREIYPLQNRVLVHTIRAQGGESSPEKAVKVLIHRALASIEKPLPSDPVKSKTVYLLAALLAETFRSEEAKFQKNFFECAVHDFPPNAKRSFPRKLSRRKLDSDVEAPCVLKEMEESDEYNYGEAAVACWDGAEAFHLYILYHEHLSRKRFEDAMCAAASLTQYAAYIKMYVAYEMLALASYYAKHWHACSTALMRLESITGSPSQHKANIANLAVAIFSCRSPAVLALDDSSPPACPSCQAQLESWNIMCQQCGIPLPFYIGNDKPIFAPRITTAEYPPSDAWKKADPLRLRSKAVNSDVLS